MISIMETAPADVAAFRATGKVEKSDYENVVIPKIDELARSQDKINFIMVLDTDLSDFTIGAMADDLGVGLKHFKKWNKMAIVSESKAINKFTDIFSYIAPGEAKGFTHAELDTAMRWVSS